MWHNRKHFSEANSALCGRSCRRISRRLLRRRMFTSAFASAVHNETQAAVGWLAGDVWMTRGVAACYYYPSVRTQRSRGHRPKMTTSASQHNPFVTQKDRNTIIKTILIRTSGSWPFVHKSFIERTQYTRRWSISHTNNNYYLFAGFSISVFADFYP